MKEKFLTEKLTYYRTLITLSWTSTFLLGSGVSWSIINLHKLKNIFIPAGCLFIVFLAMTTLFLHFRVKKLLKELQK